MTPLLLDEAPLTADEVGDEEFLLDVRVVEADSPLMIDLCDTSDNCGSTCSTSACNSVSNDPS